jgi:hypothetical protein
MNDGWIRGLAVAALVVVLSTAIGIGAYNAGAAHAVAEGSEHVHWGHGFFPLFPLFFVFFFFFIMRALWWGLGGGWGPRGWYGHRYRYYRGVPPEFEEWHRQAHAEEPPPKP